MELTAKQALGITLELWMWLRENPGKEKDEWLGWYKYGEMAANCPLCEYSLQECDEAACSVCPIYWRSKPNLYNYCQLSDSPYAKWWKAFSMRSKRLYAGKIVKLCEEALVKMLKEGRNA